MNGILLHESEPSTAQYETVHIVDTCSCAITTADYVDGTVCCIVNDHALFYLNISICLFNADPILHERCQVRYALHSNRKLPGQDSRSISDGSG